MRSQVALLLCVAMGMGGCETSPSAERNATPVVESASPLWTASQAWQVDDRPLLVLGANEPEFASVSNAHRYDDGRIVVADSVARELIMFDAQGRLLRKIGRPGPGPGEFGAFDRVIPAGGDSLIVWDWRARRLTTFGDTGQVLRADKQEMLPATNGVDGVALNGFPVVMGRFSNGAFLARVGRATPTGIVPVSEIRNYSVEYVRVDGMTVYPLGEFFTNSGWTYVYPNTDFAFGAAPFGRVGSMAVGDTSFLFSDGAQYGITEYTMNGRPARVMRLRRLPTAVTVAHIAAFKRGFEQQDDAGMGLAAQKTVSDWMPFPKTLPAFTALVRSTNGSVWARDYNLTGTVSQYEVFNEAGRWLGTVSFPDRSTLLEAGNDWVLLRTVSRDDEPLVALHRLVQPS